MTGLVQLKKNDTRAVAMVAGNQLLVIPAARSIYDLAFQAMAKGSRLFDSIRDVTAAGTLFYDEVYEGKSEWKLLPAFDHPTEPGRCFVTGTGLTHKASVDNRNAMHSAAQIHVTDSMRMYQWGLEGGRPAPGEIGVSPEWFYKGNGTILRAHNEPLTVPAFAEDGGEEAEIAGIYVIDHEGNPRRVGMAQGNEFSDHVFEKRNYLYLASSKLRECSIGPELILDPDFIIARGHARVSRAGETLWEKEIHSGEANMCHSLENLEHHHFKFPLHRRPGDVHIHFFGASAFSFGDQVTLEEGDVMEVNYPSYGRPLRNPLHADPGPAGIVRVTPI